MTTTLNVAVEEWGTWVRVYGRPGNFTIQGPMANILQILADKLNFTYNLMQPEDHVWGVSLPDGNWTGMLGMMQRGEVEFALGPFGVTASRDTVCDFSVPVKTENSGILVVRPTMESDVAGFLRPFTLPVWLLILAGTLAVFLSFLGVMAKEASLFQQRIKGSPVATSALWVLKALTQEGTEWLPRTDGSRVVVATWLLASLVFMSSYSGILTAMLTVPRITIPIDSMWDLVTQTDIPWRLESGSWLLQFFRESPDGARRRLYEGHTGTFPDCWAARAPIASGEYAAVCDHTTMKKAMSWDFSSTGVCHLYITREIIHSFNLAMAFRTNSMYLEASDYWIQKLKESGLLAMWLERQITNTSQCLKPPSADRSSTSIAALDLQSFLGPILVLCSGLSLALLTFVMEVVVARTCCASDEHSIPSHSRLSHTSAPRTTSRHQTTYPEM